jgi:hypothetical protein
VQSAAPPAHAWAGAAATLDLPGKGSGCPPAAASPPPGTSKEASHDPFGGASARSRPVGGSSSPRSTDRPQPSCPQGALQPAATVPAALLSSRKGVAAPIPQGSAFAAAHAPPAAPCARGPLGGRAATHRRPTQRGTAASGWGFGCIAHHLVGVCGRLLLGVSRLPC